MISHGSMYIPDLHDARVVAVGQATEGSIEIQLENIVSYSLIASTPKEKYEVNSWRGSLRFFDVQALAVPDDLDSSDPVMDTRLSPPTDLAAFLERRALGVLEVTFQSGKILEVRSEEAWLELVSPPKFLEHWHGPL